MARKRTTTTAVAVLTATVLSAGAGAGPASAASCATPDTYLNDLVTKGVGCAGARKVMNRYARRCISGGAMDPDSTLYDRANPCDVKGYDCEPRKIPSGIEVVCKHGTRRISFTQQRGPK